MSERILEKLDEYLGKNDYASAEKHLLYWLSEAQVNDDARTTLLVCNELMGLCRKLSRRDDALYYAEAALCQIDKMGIGQNVGAATTYLNCATVYKAFDMPERAMPLFERARTIYEGSLSKTDTRLGGLYNNMALALVDLKSFDKARDYYKKALSVMEKNENGKPECAITYLNMASAAEAELGLENAEYEIAHCIEKATQLLDESISETDGNYAFVCEKCASVFGYYGYFFYEEELRKRAERIYERS